MPPHVYTPKLMLSELTNHLLKSDKCIAWFWKVAVGGGRQESRVVLLNKSPPPPPPPKTSNVRVQLI